MFYLLKLNWKHFRLTAEIPKILTLTFVINNHKQITVLCLKHRELLTLKTASYPVCYMTAVIKII